MHPVPLRERQRLETWSAIHEAAIALVAEDGIGGTTIEGISEAAGISRRTFFNYFQTKEDAVLGARQPQVLPEALAAFRAADDDPFESTTRLLLDVLNSTIEESDGRDRRRDLVRRYPELHARMLQHIAESERQVAEVLEQYSSLDSETARALLRLASAAVRFAYPADSTRERDTAITRFRALARGIL